MFLSPRFRYRPFIDTLAGADAFAEDKTIEDAAVVFVHAEENDQLDSAKRLTKFLKNVKWLANKRKVNNIVLHSFTHLSESKATPDFAESFLKRAAERLSNSGYSVHVTPFGYSCEWELAVHGEPLAKVFKSI